MYKLSRLKTIFRTINGIKTPVDVIDDKLDDNSVDTINLVDNAITESKLANNSVSESKLANNSVSLEKLSQYLQNNLLKVTSGTEPMSENDDLAAGTIYIQYE